MIQWFTAWWIAHTFEWVVSGCIFGFALLVFGIIGIVSILKNRRPKR